MTTLEDVRNNTPRMTRDQLSDFEVFVYMIKRNAKKVFGKGNLNPAMMLFSNTSEGYYSFGDFLDSPVLDNLIRRTGIKRKSFSEMAAEKNNLETAASLIPCKHRNYRVAKLDVPAEVWVHYGALLLPERSIIVEDYTFSQYYFGRWRCRTVIKHFWFELTRSDIGVFGKCPTYLDEQLRLYLGMNVQSFPFYPWSEKRGAWALGIINLENPDINIDYR